MQLLNSDFTLQSEDELVYEKTSVFKCNKVSLKIEIIEFQEDKYSKKIGKKEVFKSKSDLP